MNLTITPRDGFGYRNYRIGFDFISGRFLSEVQSKTKLQLRTKLYKHTGPLNRKQDAMHAFVMKDIK
jgi:hypothetical protein